jgi:hypothetical protein
MVAAPEPQIKGTIAMITTTEILRFRELQLGERFEFDPGVWSFSGACRKTGPRTYVRSGDSSKLSMRVGSIDVGVKRAPHERAPRALRKLGEALLAELHATPEPRGKR